MSPPNGLSVSLENSASCSSLNQISSAFMFCVYVYVGMVNTNKVAHFVCVCVHTTFNLVSLN